MGLYFDQYRNCLGDWFYMDDHSKMLRRYFDVDSHSSIRGGSGVVGIPATR
jgi:hypothetical protein